MAYGQWIQVILENTSKKALSTSDTDIRWGKFYDAPDKDKEVATEDVNHQPIPSKESFQFAACGRENASSGTDGQMDIMDCDKRIFQLYWNCPWSGSNELNVKHQAKNWYPFIPAFSKDGAIGTVNIKILYQGM